MIAIFDWDGTLCNSVDHIVESMQAAASERGFSPPAAEAVREIVGLGLPQAMARLFPGVDEGERLELAAAYSRHFADPGRAPPQLFDGALDTLETLRGRGIELAVATGKSRRGLNRVLDSLGLGDFFDATRCADETRSKPHPQMLLEIMAVRGKAATEAVMVGDSEYDLDMARGACVQSVGVSFGVHDRQRLSAFGPIAVIDDLPELLDLPALSALSQR